MKLCCEYWFLSMHDALQVKVCFLSFLHLQCNQMNKSTATMISIQMKTCWEEFSPHSRKTFSKSVIPVFPENQIFYGYIEIKSDSYVDVKCTLTTTNSILVKSNQWSIMKERGWHSRLVRGLRARGPEFDSRISHPCFDFFPFCVA